MAEKPHSSSSIMYVVIAIALLLIVLAVPLSNIGKGALPGSAGDDVDQRIQPVARFDLKKAATTGGAPKDGPTVYASVCQACHASGAAGAPKAGDKAAWAPRIAKGQAEILKSVINGKGAMPPKGGAASLSEGEIKAAVEHLVGLAK